MARRWTGALPCVETPVMDSPQELNPAKVRAGLAIVTAIFLVSAVLIVVVDDAIGRSIFFAVAALTMVRIALLARSLRKDRAAARLAGPTD